MANSTKDSMKLRVQEAVRYDGTFHRDNPPTEIGCFSFDSDSKYCDDGHQLKYLSMPGVLADLYMDLNKGFRNYIHVYEDTDNNYSAILKWILYHQDTVEKKFPVASNGPKIDFVCFRGLLTAISSTIYEKREDWLFYATKFRSVIYLCDVKTDRKMEELKNATRKQILMTTWGFKFEQYMVSDARHLKPKTSVPVNENEKYFAVMKRNLGHHRILCSAEVDGVDPKQERRHKPSSMLPYIELKTSRLITSDRQEANFRRFKLIKWYLQSYLAGIPRIICGFRDDDGIVRELESYNVADIPTRAKGAWSPAACLHFCSHVLDYVKQCVVKDDPEVVYEFYWKPGEDITCKELESKHQFLPQWYTDAVEVI